MTYGKLTITLAHSVPAARQPGGPI